MKRENTACKEMIEEIKALKKSGIDCFICHTVYTINGKDHWLKPVAKQTAQGISAYANKMFRKYGDYTSVVVGYFDKNDEWNVYTTYQA